MKYTALWDENTSWKISMTPKKLTSHSWYVSSLLLLIASFPKFPNPPKKHFPLPCRHYLFDMPILWPNVFSSTMYLFVFVSCVESQFEWKHLLHVMGSNADVYKAMSNQPQTEETKWSQQLGLNEVKTKRWLTRMPNRVQGFSGQSHSLAPCKNKQKRFDDICMPHKKSNKRQLWTNIA